MIDAATRVGTFFINLISTGITKACEFVNSVSNFIRDLPGKIWNGIVGAVQKVAEWGINLVTKGREAAKSLVDGIWNTICELPGKMLDIGRNLVEGLWNGIRNVKDWILGKIREFGQGILNGIKGFLGIASPSKLFENEVGKNLALGFGKGFTDSMKEISNDMQNSIPTEFDTGLKMNAQNSLKGNNIIGKSDGFVINIENFNNNRSQDVQAFAKELEFYSRRSSWALG